MGPFSVTQPGSCRRAHSLNQQGEGGLRLNRPGALQGKDLIAPPAGIEGAESALVVALPGEAVQAVQAGEREQFRFAFVGGGAGIFPLHIAL